MGNRKQTVAYCRVSTLEQTQHGNGMAIQMRDVAAFAQRHGFAVDRFYRDEAQSGAREDRSALRGLLRDCRKGRIGTVIVPNLERLSRNVRIAENLFYRFEQKGISVLIANMPAYNGTNCKDVFVRQILEVVAEQNRKDIIEQLWKGRQERVRRGLPPGGNVSYGYRRVEKHIALDPVEADVVRLIFELAGRGLSGARIAAALNERALRRRNGRPWVQRQVAAIIGRRQLYARGVVRYGEVESVNEGLILVT